jgi:hypothetical protein
MRGGISSQHTQAGANHLGGAGTSHLVYMYAVRIDGVLYRCQISRIIAMYAIGELMDGLVDAREVHHVDGNHANWKPSNLVLVENRKQHKLADLWSRAQKLSWGKFKAIPMNGAVCIGDVIRDDDFDIQIAIEWWLRQVKK